MENTRGRGRPPGSPNRFTKEVKDAFQAAFNALQSEADNPAALAMWAKSNPTDFYRIVSRMLPQGVEITGEDGGPIAFSGLEWCGVKPAD